MFLFYFVFMGSIQNYILNCSENEEETSSESEEESPETAFYLDTPQRKTTYKFIPNEKQLTKIDPPYVFIL